MTRIKRGFKILTFGVLATACVIVGGVASARGGVTASAEEIRHVCTENEYCLVCDVANQINALPTPEEITIENAAAVTQQIHNIDRIKWEMTDEEFEEFRTLVKVENYGDIVRYNNAVEKLREFDGFTQFAISKKLDVGDRVEYDEETEVSFAVRNVATNKTVELTMFYLYEGMSVLGAEAYRENTDGWTFTYALPAGTYEVIELNTDKPIALNGENVYMYCESMTFNGETVAGNGITVTLDENAYNEVSVFNSLADLTVSVKDNENQPIAGVNVSYWTKDFTDVYAQEWLETTDSNGEIIVASSWDTSAKIVVDNVPDGYCVATNCEIACADNAINGEDGSPVLEMNFEQISFSCSLVLYKHEYSHGDCVACDAVDESQGHGYGALVETQVATCETDGVKAHYYCEGCGSYLDETQTPVAYADLIIPAYGHAYGALIEENAATCEEDGVKAHYACADCGKYFDEEKNEVAYEDLLLHALGHEYSAWIETQAPTTEAYGERKQVCLNCGDVVVEKIPMLEPSATENYSTVAFIVLGVILLMGVVAIVVSKNDWTK